MADEWIVNAADKELTGAQKQLKKYNASRKLRKAALGIIAQQRMERALKAPREGARARSDTGRRPPAVSSRRRRALVCSA